MSTAIPSPTDATASYMNRVRAGLKDFDSATQQEILSEIRGHVGERI